MRGLGPEWAGRAIEKKYGLKSCTFLLENVSHRVPPSNLRDFSLFGVCPSNNHYPSARCVYAANVMGKDLDIFAIGAVSLNRIYIHQPKMLLLFVHTLNVLCYVVLSYHVLVTTPHLRLFVCLLFCINVLFPPVLACTLSLSLCCVCPYVITCIYPVLCP
jgi:hypothetical protein